MKNTITTIIPAYRNTELFLKNLSHNKKFLSSTEVIIVNDYPQEDITKSVLAILPDAVVITNKKNLGFSGTINRGVESAKGEYLMFLNSDVQLLDSTFLKAIPLFQSHTKLFAVSFAQKTNDGKIVGANTGAYKRGFIVHKGRTTTTLSPNLWAEGGAMICRKELYLGLGQLDTMYSPFYEEDRDLSYRAWKSGYEVLFDPSIIVNHNHESTIKSYFDTSKVQTIAFRNLFLFHWKNLDDVDFRIIHLLFLPFHLLKAVLTGNIELIKGFMLAISHFPSIFHVKNKNYYGDREVLSKFTYVE